MNKSTIATAILATIRKFHDQKKSFSAYQITQDIRFQINLGSLNLTDLPPADGNHTGQTVPHPVVRQQVHEFFAEDLIPNYSAVDVFRDGAGFVEYQYDPKATSTSDVALNALDNPPLLTSKPPVTQPQPTRQTHNLFTGNPINNPFTNSVTAKVTVTSPANPPKNNGIPLNDLKKYINTKFSSGQTVTLKQIQSRFKKNPTTCKQIAGLARAAGYRVVINVLDAPSLDLVTR